MPYPRTPCPSSAGMPLSCYPPDGSTALFRQAPPLPVSHRSCSRPQFASGAGPVPRLSGGVSPPNGITEHVIDLLKERKKEVEALIRPVQGFVSYSRIRTAGGGASATVCQDKTAPMRACGSPGSWKVRLRAVQPRQSSNSLPLSGSGGGVQTTTAYGRRARTCKNRGSRCQRRPLSERIA